MANNLKLITFFFLFFLSKTSAQQLHLSILTDNNKAIIDSINYKKIHVNAKSIIDETNLFAEKLSKAGFLENRIINQKKINDSTYIYRYDLGKQTKSIHIFIDNKFKELFNIKNDSIILKYNQIESFLNSNLQKLENSGFALSKFQLINIQKKKDYLIADLQIVTSKKRNLNGFVIKGYDKFPVGYKKSLERKYRNQVFNQENLKKINSDFNKIRFVKQSKYPEILFTTDSTKVYVYIEKAKTNTFDGFIGFTNDEQGEVVFNGNIDLVLNNALNIGEKLQIYWRSDGRNQKIFNGSAEIPYLFNSPVALKTQLNILQDSIFQNTKTAIDLGYYLNFNSKVFLGYQNTESTNTEKSSEASSGISSITNFNNSYYTGTYEYINYNLDDYLFPEKINFNCQIGTGKRNTKLTQTNQFYGLLTANYHLYLTRKTAINLKTQNYYLNSKTYIINELYRFGGINSIRGFNENSLQANTLVSLMSEYQYILSSSLYLHSIIDYGYFEDKSTEISGKLLSVGFGFGLQTNNGLMKFAYTNGSFDDQQNSIVHISLKTNF